jgi:hypothetical protein
MSPPQFGLSHLGDARDRSSDHDLQKGRLEEEP